MSEENGVTPTQDAPVQDNPADKVYDKDASLVNDPAKPDATNTDPNKDVKVQDGAPEKYEDFTFPEGVEADKELMEQFTPLAKELNLSQDNAQKLVDLYNSKLQEQWDASQNSWENVKKQWGEAAKADKEYGGQNFQENLATARKALAQFGTPELKEAFDVTGTGNHPEFIRFLVRVGKAISEDGVVGGSNPKGAPRDPAKVLFPDMN